MFCILVARVILYWCLFVGPVPLFFDRFSVIVFLKEMFNRKIFKKKQREDIFPSGVQSVNLLSDRGRHLRGKIVIGHCRR